MNQTSYNPYRTAQQQFDHAANLLELDQSTRDLLRIPMWEHHFSIPLRKDQGEVIILRGFRVLHNDALGPGKVAFASIPWKPSTLSAPWRCG